MGKGKTGWGWEGQSGEDVGVGGHGSDGACKVLVPFSAASLPFAGERSKVTH